MAMPPAPPQSPESRISADRTSALLPPTHFPTSPITSHQLVPPSPSPTHRTHLRAESYALAPSCQYRLSLALTLGCSVHIPDPRLPHLTANYIQHFIGERSMYSPRFHLALAATLKLLPHTQPPSLATPASLQAR
ncbi:hypothetical protein BD779DRAFT_1680621 [Infundibulicybe gibba]|nr:hypothetical protein BD779DRAFT_1680621 [Infundibulicybe gibba]